MAKKKLKRSRSGQDLKQRKVDALEARNRMNQQLMQMVQGLRNKQDQAPYQYELPQIMPGVIPEGQQSAIAMDCACSGIASWVNQNPQFYGGFLGYPVLAQMTQSSDYRAVPETTAGEMVREWGKVKVVGDGDDELSDRIQRLEKRLKELGIRDLIRQLIETEMIFGRAQLFINLKGQEAESNLPLLLKANHIKKGDLIGFKLVEPMWTTPSLYNSTDPMADDFYQPSKWYVLGKEYHSDRLLTLVMRPVPDLLKPAYNFSGISMLQLMQPYVERWQRTVDAVSDLIHAFSLTGLKTDLSDILAGDDTASSTILRTELFNLYRNNLNTLLVDKEAEEFFQINTPLTTLDALVRQAQEQMAGPSHTPLVKLLGITPSGLNANSDGEIRVYNDYISSQQEAHLRPIIETILRVVQLDLFGEINESVVFEFNSLHQLNDEQRANVNKTKAETAVMLTSGNLVSTEEARDTLAKDETGDYSGIDAEDVPDWEGLNSENPESETDHAA
ncbi:DUF1073 domain-containing protein [Acinetobacter stercoris]|uniref:Anti-CBASS protein Acb1-like N-terminal domain-containing protein n=1 Tax=Acinetobacter stercoris TaxID=2126983 RepID=A0A2U3MZK1_9GAMM|nr:DUF1073 domain-containing protein [Acinetobacter stercoris]SPL70852.1 hypothetical protein KPC_2030 [Acinetobacter stercoris]